MQTRWTDRKAAHRERSFILNVRQIPWSTRDRKSIFFSESNNVILLNITLSILHSSRSFAKYALRNHIACLTRCTGLNFIEIDRILTRTVPAAPILAKSYRSLDVIAVWQTVTHFGRPKGDITVKAPSNYAVQLPWGPYPFTRSL